MEQSVLNVIETHDWQVYPDPFQITPLGLRVNGSPTFEQWADFGMTLRGIKNAVQWAVGDWCNYGESAYGEKYVQAINETHYAYGTLRNYASVAARVDLSHRVTELSWSHHAVVVSEPPERQETLLSRAVKEKLGRDDLSAIVRPKPTPRKPLIVASGSIGDALAEVSTALRERAVDVRIVVYPVESSAVAERVQ